MSETVRLKRTIHSIRNWIMAHPWILWALAALLSSISGGTTVSAAGFRGWIKVVILLHSVPLTVLVTVYAGPRLVRAFCNVKSQEISGTKSERRIFFVAALILILSLTALGPLKGLVGNLHQPGAASIDATVATRAALIPSASDARTRTSDAIRTWWEFAQPCRSHHPPMNCNKAESQDPEALAETPTTTPESPFPDYPDAPITLSAIYFSIDSFLIVPGYLVTLILLISWGRRAIYNRRRNIIRTAGSNPPRWLLLVSTWAALTTVAAAVADLAENALAAQLLRNAWNRYSPGSPSDLPVNDAWFWILPSISLIKAAALALGVIWVIWFSWTALRHSGSRDHEWTESSGLWRTIVLLRVPIVIVVVLAAGVIYPSQTSEIFWRWPDSRSHAASAVVLAFALSFAIYLVTQWQLIRAEIYDSTKITVSLMRTRPRRISGRVWIAITAAATVLLMALISSDYRFFLPLAIFLALYFFVLMESRGEGHFVPPMSSRLPRPKRTVAIIPVIAIVMLLPLVLDRSSGIRYVLLRLAFVAVYAHLSSLLLPRIASALGDRSAPEPDESSSQHTEPPKETESAQREPDSSLRSRLLLPLGFTLLVIASGLLVYVSIPGFTFKPFIGMTMIVLIALVGYPLRTDPTGTTLREPGLGRSTVPFILSAGIPILMAIGALRATAQMLPYELLRDVSAHHRLVLPIAVVVLVTPAVVYGLAWSARFGKVWLPRPVRTLEEGFFKYLESKSVRVPERLLELERRSVGWRQPLLLLTLSVIAWIAVVIAIDGNERLYGVTAFVGPAAIVLIFFLLVACLLSALIEFVDWFTPRAPRVLSLLSFQRMPVILFLMTWLIIGAIRPPSFGETLYDVRIVDVGNGDLQDQVDPRQAETLEAAFNQWRWQNCLVSPSETNDAGQKPVVPLIMIATSGGGIRAAVWTSYVMDRAIGYDTVGALNCDDNPVGAAAPVERVFAASGISGGSVGLATWAARELESNPRRDPSTCPKESDSTASFSNCEDEAGARPWIQEQLGRDFLSPQLSWFLFVETPWSFVRVGLDQSRADVLDNDWERAWGTQDDPRDLFELRVREFDWETAWRERAADGLDENDIAELYMLLETQSDSGSNIPLLIFNGTSAESGCRFNSSTLSGNDRPTTEPATACLQPAQIEESTTTVLPATNDLADYLCPDADIRLSTAALLSARFPVLSPAGHLTQCGALGEAASQTWVIDGGYLEAAGAVTVADLWSALEPLIEEHNRDPLSAAYIVPVVIQIDNGHIEPAGPNETTAPPQFLAPIKGVIGSRNGNNSLNRQSVQAIFSKPYIVAYDETGQPIRWCGQRYANFSLLAHPGPRARLGWILSDVGFSDLKDQFRRNPVPVEIVDGWRGDLSGQLSTNQIIGEC